MDVALENLSVDGDKHHLGLGLSVMDGQAAVRSPKSTLLGHKRP